MAIIRDSITHIGIKTSRMCHMHITLHTAIARLVVHCTATWAQAATRKRSLSSIVGPCRNNSSTLPALLSSKRSGRCIFVGKITGLLRQNRMKCILMIYGSSWGNVDGCEQRFSKGGGFRNPNSKSRFLQGCRRFSEASVVPSSNLLEIKEDTHKIKESPS